MIIQQVKESANHKLSLSGTKRSTNPSRSVTLRLGSRAPLPLDRGGHRGRHLYMWRLHVYGGRVGLYARRVHRARRVGERGVQIAIVHPGIHFPHLRAAALPEPQLRLGKWRLDAGLGGVGYTDPRAPLGFW